MYIGLHKKYSFVFLDRFFQNSQISNFLKIRLLGAVLFHVDRQTDVQAYRQTNRYDKANSRFGSFAKRASKPASNTKCGWRNRTAFC
jgi:hypothetical protein